MKDTLNHMNKVEEKSNDLKKLRFDHDLPKCCGTCKHFEKSIVEEPCFICNNYLSKWERQKS